MPIIPVNAALAPLLVYTICDYDGDIDGALDYDSFEGMESGPAELWQPLRDDIIPRIVGAEVGEPYCGRASMHITAPYALHTFDRAESAEVVQSAGGFPTRAYPAMCAALRLLPGTRAGMVLAVSYFARGGTVAVTSSTGFTTTASEFNLDRLAIVLNAPPGERGDVVGAQWPIADDGEWHYSCIDLHAQLESTLVVRHGGARISNLLVSSLSISPLEQDVDGTLHAAYTGGEGGGGTSSGLYIDDFFIGAEPITITRAPPSTHPLHDIAVTRVSGSGADELVVEIEQLGCQGALPLLTADVYDGGAAIAVPWSSASAPNTVGYAVGVSLSPPAPPPEAMALLGSVSAVRQREAICMDGGVKVRFDGNDESALVPWNATAATVASVLAQLQHPTALLHVKGEGSGHGAVAWHVSRLDAGPLPTLRIIDADHLSGASASASVSELVPYGLDVLPVGGNWMQATSATPTVSVRLRGQAAAACSATNWAALHEGCFNSDDIAADAAFAPTSQLSSSSMTLERCSLQCKDSPRFMVSRSWCYCLPSAGNSTASPVDGESCAYECGGDSSQICGSWNHISAYAAPNATSPCAFDFVSLAPRLSSVHVGTVQQTPISIAIRGFELDGIGPPTVSIDGHALTVLSHSATQIITSLPSCKPAAQASLLVHVAGSGFAAIDGVAFDPSTWSGGPSCAAISTSSPPQQPVPSPPPMPLTLFTNSSAALPPTAPVPWSSSVAWGGQSPPSEGATAIIPAGTSVLLDVSPPPLELLLVQGALVFARVDLNLTARYIFVAQGASLTVGTEESPFLQRVVITLLGAPTALELPVYGAKVLACRGCTLDLHGAPTLRSWTRLAATAAAGSSTLTLVEPVDWPVGSELVIASTSSEMEEAERVTLASLDGSGTSLGLTAPLAHEHLGETHTFGGQPVDLRAEVRRAGPETHRPSPRLVASGPVPSDVV